MSINFMILEQTLELQALYRDNKYWYSIVVLFVIAYTYTHETMQCWYSLRTEKTIHASGASIIFVILSTIAIDNHQRIYNDMSLNIIWWADTTFPSICIFNYWNQFFFFYISSHHFSWPYALGKHIQFAMTLTFWINIYINLSFPCAQC